MNRLIVGMVFVFAVFLTANSNKEALAQAPASGDCVIHHGGGGERVFPEWSPNRKVVVIPFGQKASVWLPARCNKGTGRWGVGYSKEMFEVSEETTSNLAVGVRITFTAKPGTGRSTAKLIVDTPARSFELVALVAPTYDEAVTGELRKDIESLRKETGDLNAGLGAVREKSEEASGKSDAALKASHEAKARKEVGIEILLNPMINFETPGETGGGVALSMSGTLGRFANNMIHLGIAGSVSWHSYEMELVGTNNVNMDVFGHEVDAMAKFMFKFQPHRVIGIYLETGFGVRFFTHDDSVSVQESDTLRIRGVEGSADIHPLWGLEIGLRVYPYKWLVLGLGFHTVASLTRQVTHPSGDAHITAIRDYAWHYGLVFSLGAKL